MALKEEKVLATSGKKKASVRKETIAVSGMRVTVVPKTQNTLPPRLSSHPSHEVEVCRFRGGRGDMAVLAQNSVTTGLSVGRHGSMKEAGRRHSELKRKAEEAHTRTFLQRESIRRATSDHVKSAPNTDQGVEHPEQVSLVCPETRT